MRWKDPHFYLSLSLEERAFTTEVRAVGPGVFVGETPINSFVELRIAHPRKI